MQLELVSASRVNTIMSIVLRYERTRRAHSVADFITWTRDNGYEHQMIDSVFEWPGGWGR